jgi:hypothetical protein
MVKTLCSTPTETLLFETKAANIQDRLLDFMNKVAYVDLNMNSTNESFDEGPYEVPIESDLTVIAKSIDNIRCINNSHIRWRQNII